MLDGARPVVFLSAGHAASPDNRGNTGAYGQIEEDTTLAAAVDLAPRLAAAGFEVVLARTGDARPSFDERLAHAARVGAAALVELHTDVRAGVTPFVLPDGRVGQRSVGEHGFSVLYNDRTTLTEARERLAVALAGALTGTGFVPYGGGHYQGQYEPHATPGVFRDRRGLKMLRASAMPSVIVETHNATDAEEVLRFGEEGTRAAFAAAMAAGLAAGLLD